MPVMGNQRSLQIIPQIAGQPDELVLAQGRGLVAQFFGITDPADLDRAGCQALIPGVKNVL
jgi:hypothetical protein